MVRRFDRLRTGIAHLTVAYMVCGKKQLSADYAD